MSRIFYQSYYYSGTPLTFDTLNRMGPKDFFNKYWSPYLKNAKLCTLPSDCGYDKSTDANKAPWKMMNGDDFYIHTPYGGLGWVETDNDTTRLLFSYGAGTVIFYPLAIANKDEHGVQYKQGKAINIFLADINGPKVPNVIGRDVFMFQIDDKSKIQPFECTGEYATKNNCDDDCRRGRTGFPVLIV